MTVMTAQTADVDAIVGHVRGILDRETFVYKGFTCEPLNEELTRWSVCASAEAVEAYRKAMDRQFHDHIYDDVTAERLRQYIDTIWQLASEG